MFGKIDLIVGKNVLKISNRLSGRGSVKTVMYPHQSTKYIEVEDCTRLFHIISV